MEEETVESHARNVSMFESVVLLFRRAKNTGFCLYGEPHLIDDYLNHVQVGYIPDKGTLADNKSYTVFRTEDGWAYTDIPNVFRDDGEGNSEEGVVRVTSLCRIMPYRHFFDATKATKEHYKKAKEYVTYLEDNPDILNTVKIVIDNEAVLNSIIEFEDYDFERLKPAIKLIKENAVEERSS